MKFAKVWISSLLLLAVLSFAVPANAKMGNDFAASTENTSAKGNTQAQKKLSFKERVAKRLVEKRIKKALKKQQRKAKNAKQSPRSLSINNGDLVTIILAVVLVVLVIALLQTLLSGGLMTILTIVLLALLILYVGRMFL